MQTQERSGTLAKERVSPIDRESILSADLVPSCKSSRNHSLAVVARKPLLSRARQQAFPYANFCNLVLVDYLFSLTGKTVSCGAAL